MASNLFERKNRNLIILFIVCSLFIFYNFSIPKSTVKRLTTSEISSLEDAAVKGDVSAQVSLGRVFEFGAGVPQDYKQALYWFLQSAQKADTSVLISIAGIYEEGGRGVERNPKEAYFWYSVASLREDLVDTSKMNKLIPLLTPDEKKLLEERAKNWVGSSEDTIK